jgi:vancomycin resistance protein YoaR
VGTSLAILLGLGAGLTWAWERSVLVRIDGYEYLLDADDRPALARVLKLRARRHAGQSTYLRTDRDVLELSTQDAGYELDVAGALGTLEARIAEARASARASWAGSLSRALVGRPLEVEMDLPFRFHPQSARLTLARVKRQVDRRPRDAQLLIDQHRIIRSQWGAELSVEATLLRLERAREARDEIVDAVITPLRPQVTEEELIPVDVTRVLSSFETSFRGKAGPRGVNIRRAAKYLDGAVILPGEVLSFNHRVGRRVHGRGFVDAPVIINDEMEKDVGGGVCQVATALHGAAVYANMEIVRRRSHSRPSGYAPIGLDATVIDGKVDLQIRNPYDEPLLVHATFPEPYLLRVELLGREPSAKVEHAALVKNQEPFARRIWFKDDLAKGSFDKKQKGSPGMDVTSVLRIRHEGGKVERRTYPSKYYPVPEVFYAGPGTELGRLPSLPDGATGLVVDGEELGDPRRPAPAEETSPSDVPTIDEADGMGRDRG